MRGSTGRVATLAVATAVTAATLSVPFGAAPAIAAPAAGARLTLVIHHGSDLTGPVDARATLDCFPAGGTHPHPQAACAALESVNGDFEALPNTHAICPHIVDPVTVTATGHWLGRPVLYVRTFPNRCLAAAGTDDVFGF